MVSHDLFGFMVQLNFNKKGSSHNTLIGGIMSLLIKGTMLFYFVLRGATIITHADDDYCSIEYLLDPLVNHEYLMNYTNLILTASVNKIRNGRLKVDFDDLETKKYIELRYV